MDDGTIEIEIIMRKKLLLSVLVAMAGMVPSIAHAAGDKTPQYILHEVKAPFDMEPVKEYVFPDRKFPITKYGAKPGGTYDNTKAIAKAIDKCNKAGGGMVVVPAGYGLQALST